MRSLRILLALSLLISMLAGTQQRDAVASVQSTQFNPQVQAIATDIVEGTITKTTSIYVDNEAFTISEVEIAATVKGSLEGNILIEVPGGFTPEGYEEIVSHQPRFVQGDDVSLAMTLSERPEFAEAVGAGDLPIYAIVNGIDGAVSVAETLRARVGNYGDFMLTGQHIAAFPNNYYINPASSGHSVNDTIGSIFSAMETWENDPGSLIDMSYKGTSTRTGFGLDGFNNVSFDPALATDDGVLAQAKWWRNRQNETVEWDIRFNTRWTWSTDGTPSFSEFDMETVLLHEAGHVLGLTHTRADAPVRMPGIGEVMHPGLSRGTVKGLGDGDRSGVATLYTAPARVTGPESGTILECGRTLFEWEGLRSGNYMVRFGSTRGGAQYGQLDVGATQSYLSGELPSNGTILYFEVLYKAVGSTGFVLQNRAVYRLCLPPSGFVDVPMGVYYEDPVIWAVENNITTGTTATTFSPRSFVTRAQMATFLWRHAGKPEPTISNPFADVPPGRFYSDAVVWLAETGITSGTSANSFSPHTPLNRVQLALLLWRYAGEPAPTSPNPFTDVANGVLGSDAIAWLAETGVTTGTSPTTFAPAQTLLREQAVTFLYRFDNLNLPG